VGSSTLSCSSSWSSTAGSWLPGSSRRRLRPAGSWRLLAAPGGLLSARGLRRPVPGSWGARLPTSSTPAARLRGARLRPASGGSGARLGGLRCSTPAYAARAARRRPAGVVPPHTPYASPAPASRQGAMTGQASQMVNAGRKSIALVPCGRSGNMISVRPRHAARDRHDPGTAAVPAGPGASSDRVEVTPPVCPDTPTCSVFWWLPARPRGARRRDSRHVSPESLGRCR